MPNQGSVLSAENGIAAPEPFAHQSYCKDAARRDDPRDRAFRQSFCDGVIEPAVVQLTEERYELLRDVQRQVNSAIVYRSTTTWDPLAKEGDCKTFAARKELELLERGWPAGALRIATAFVNDNPRRQYEYHAVLLVDTDRGTMVLDNRHAGPRRWEDVGYVWMTAQAPGRQNAWVRLPADDRIVDMALAANARPAAPVTSLQ